MFLAGFGLSQFGVAWQVALQENIPHDRMARVSSYDALGSFVAIPLGQLVAGPLSLAVGDRSTVDGGAVLVVLATLAALAVPSVRLLVVREDKRGAEGDEERRVSGHR